VVMISARKSSRFEEVGTPCHISVRSDPGGSIFARKNRSKDVEWRQLDQIAGDWMRLWWRGSRKSKVVECLQREAQALFVTDGASV
jgi:hypothetical protein